MSEPYYAAPLPTAARPTRRYFIADVHLDGQDTPRALAFRAFLKRLAAEAQSATVELYVLGDLFEFWYEYRAALFEVYRHDLDALAEAAKAGVSISLLFGNRDFAYGRYVQQRFGATVLGDGAKITLSDCRGAWLEHGDLLCTADKRYQRYRARIRSWPVRLLFFLMPWSYAQKMIERIKARAAADKASKRPETLELDIAAARQRLEATGGSVLICGHLHTARMESIGGGNFLFVVPAWTEQAGGVLDDGRAVKAFGL